MPIVDESIPQLSTSTLTTPHKLTSQRSVPAFLHKLFNMVNDPSTDHLIRWSAEGTSFLVEGHEEFARTVLPRFYKHNTFASFVRQLNMYDFHKIPHVKQGVLINRDNSNNEIWEFSNSHFQRSRPDLLVLVTRKRNRDRDETDSEQVNLNGLLKEIIAIKKHQNNITADLSNLRRDNEIIWQEVLSSREKHQKHQEVIAKILQFLTIVFSNEQLAFCASQSLEQHQQQQKSYLTEEKDIDGNTFFIKKDEGKGKSVLVSSPDHYHNLVNESNLLGMNEQMFYHARSAEAISHNIDQLEHNVETLAAQLGINSSLVSDNFADFCSQAQTNHTVINSAYKNNRNLRTDTYESISDFSQQHEQQVMNPTTWFFGDYVKSIEQYPTTSTLMLEQNNNLTPSIRSTSPVANMQTSNPSSPIAINTIPTSLTGATNNTTYEISHKQKLYDQATMLQPHQEPFPQHCYTTVATTATPTAVLTAVKSTNKQFQQSNLPPFLTSHPFVKHSGQPNIHPHYAPHAKCHSPVVDTIEYEQTSEHEDDTIVY
ncbi:hypothetical protein BCV71DRAFT_178091 [Rhizopus microsporus]|uniref:HSF-type DNA-binding domain-containing protein n=2 Tax=Rhizopus TaxID=4842 RepID=A0A1X0S4E6_RHIZD|nr:hypothetical protein BCV71DRAFT_178091 [Rhizopus microsporus]